MYIHALLQFTNRFVNVEEFLDKFYYRSIFNIIYLISIYKSTYFVFPLVFAISWKCKIQVCRFHIICMFVCIVVIAYIYFSLLIFELSCFNNIIVRYWKSVVSRFENILKGRCYHSVKTLFSVSFIIYTKSVIVFWLYLMPH